VEQQSILPHQQEARPHDRGYRPKDAYDGPMPPDADEDVIDQDAGNPKKASKLHYPWNQGIGRRNVDKLVVANRWTYSRSTWIWPAHHVTIMPRQTVVCLPCPELIQSTNILGSVNQLSRRAQSSAK